MAQLINNGLTRKDRAQTIVEAILDRFPNIGYPYGVKEVRDDMLEVVEEVLTEIEKPKTGTC